MTTYWLIGEKKALYTATDYTEESNHNDNTNVTVNPSITFQGPDSPASHSLTHGQSPQKTTEPNHKPLEEIVNNRDRIKHEIASFVAKDLINNIDSAVREFRKSQSEHFASHTKVNYRHAPQCNGSGKDVIVPKYDKEVVINKGKVRDVVKRFNSCVRNEKTCETDSKKMSKSKCCGDVKG